MKKSKFNSQFLTYLYVAIYKYEESYNLENKANPIEAFSDTNYERLLDEEK